MAKTLTSSPANGNTGNRGKLVLGGIVVAAALGAGSFFLGSLLSNRAAPPAPAAPVIPAPIFVALDAFTVNLKGEDGDRFLHTGLSIKVADAATQARIAEYLPEARSRILLLLSAKQPPELATVDGKHKLAGEIQQALAKPFAAGLPQQQITDVLFTSFVVQ
jgi:flagellar FliL protein